MDRFVAGTASRSKRRVIVRHLLAGCSPCAARLQSAFQPPIEAAAYDDLFARLIDAIPAQAGFS
jgi:hypothetical protein